MSVAASVRVDTENIAQLKRACKQKYGKTRAPIARTSFREKESDLDPEFPCRMHKSDRRSDDFIISLQIP